MRVLFATGWLVVLSSSGCGSNHTMCSFEARAGVNVALKDAVTKKPVCDAKVVITGDDVRDEPPAMGPDCLYSGAVERAGTFKVEITHPSFAPVTRENIEVKMDEAGCHVEQQRIEIELSN